MLAMSPFCQSNSPLPIAIIWHKMIAVLRCGTDSYQFYEALECSRGEVSES